MLLLVSCESQHIKSIIRFVARLSAGERHNLPHDPHGNRTHACTLEVCFRHPLIGCHSSCSATYLSLYLPCSCFTVILIAFPSCYVYFYDWLPIYLFECLWIITCVCYSSVPCNYPFLIMYFYSTERDLCISGAPSVFTCLLMSRCLSQLPLFDYLAFYLPLLACIRLRITACVHV